MCTMRNFPWFRPPDTDPAASFFDRRLRRIPSFSRRLWRSIFILPAIRQPALCDALLAQD